MTFTKPFIFFGIVIYSTLTGCEPNESATTSELQVSRDTYKRAEIRLSGRRSEYIWNDSVSPNWIDDEEAFWYSRRTKDGGKEFIRVELNDGAKSRAFDHDLIETNLSKLIEKPITATTLPFDKFTYDEEGGISFKVVEKQFSCGDDDCQAVETEDLDSLIKPRETPSPNGKWAIYFKDHNLWVRSLDGSTDFALTTDGVENSTYGTSVGTDRSTVTRQRFGVSETPIVRFSPDGNKALVQYIDQRKVKELHLLANAPKDRSRRPKLYSYPYAFALDEHKPLATFVVFDLEKGGVRTDFDYPPLPITIVPHTHPAGAPELRWTPDGAAFYFIHRYDYGKGYAIVRADTETGKTEVVDERRSDKTSGPAVSIARPGLLRQIEDEGIIWFSDEDGWGHLYYTSRRGNRRQLTSGTWNVISIISVDLDTGKVYFLRTLSEEEGNPYHDALAVVSFDGSGMETLTPEHGRRRMNRRHFSPTGDVFVDVYSSETIPGRSVLRRIDGTLIAELERADITRLEETGVVLPETFTVTAADGATKLWGKIIKPADFDPSKSYPVVDSIYPGPQTTRVNHQFAGLDTGLFDIRGEPHALAELGFIVVIVDGRGTPLRSRSFHYNSEESLLGEAGFLSDHIAAIKELAETRPWMDLDRVGIYGHSGGGYASTRAMLQYPDFFKVGVSSAGNHDQRIYLPIWGESYLGADDGKNYQLASNIELVENLEGKLLLVVGEMDDNVHPAHTYQLIDALIAKNKDFDLISIPYANHSVGGDPYLISRRWNYFVEHLLGAEPPKNYAIAK
ncbi:MAG: prolyl oligopeptidase family serine peptidase [Pseudomonadota bacterium]